MRVEFLSVKFSIAIFLLATLCLPAHADPLRVAAAANLQKVFTDALLPAFTKKTGVQVLPTYGATKLLAVQIENGAPIDVFVAADTITPQKLLAEKLLAVGTVQPYAVGRLVVWSRKDAAKRPQTLQDLASPAYAKIAYANPKTAPYGLAAQQAFAKVGLSASVAPRLVQGPITAYAGFDPTADSLHVGNLVSMGILLQAQSGNLNMRAALLEVATDALGSVAVLVAALVIALTGWQRADAVVSILIGLLIIPRTLKLLRETVEVLLEGTPRGLDLQSVREHLLALDHVTAVHDLHASQISSRLPVLSAHVVVEDSCFLDGHAPQMLDQLQACVAEHFEVTIEHSTFQLEPDGHTQHEATSHA